MIYILEEETKEHDEIYLTAMHRMKTKSLFFSSIFFSYTHDTQRKTYDDDEQVKWMIVNTEIIFVLDMKSAFPFCLFFWVQSIHSLDHHHHHHQNYFFSKMARLALQSIETPDDDSSIKIKPNVVKCF